MDLTVLSCINITLKTFVAMEVKRTSSAEDSPDDVSSDGRGKISLGFMEEEQHPLYIMTLLSRYPPASSRYPIPNVG